MASVPEKDKIEKVREVVRQHLLDLLTTDADVGAAVRALVSPLEPIVERIGRPQESEAALSDRMLDVLEVGLRRFVRPEALRRP